MFIPGFMQRGEAWAQIAAAVAERYPSTALDFRSHDFEGRIAEILAACPPGSVPVGYSMGGRLALHAALRAPDRFAALVTVGASAGIEDPAARAERQAADAELADWIERHPIEAVVDRWERNPVFATQPPELVAAQRPGRLSHDPRELARLLRSAGQGACPPAWDRLGELRCPLIAIAGERDERYAAAARRLAATARTGAAALVPGAGHAPQLEAPEAFAALLAELLDEHLGEVEVVDLDAEPGPDGNLEHPGARPPQRLRDPGGEELERRQAAGEREPLGGGDLERGGDAPGPVEGRAEDRLEPL